MVPASFQPEQPVSRRARPGAGGWSRAGSGTPPGQSAGADTRQPHSTGTRQSSPARKELARDGSLCRSGLGKRWVFTRLPAEALPRALHTRHQCCLRAMRQPGTRWASVAGPGKPRTAAALRLPHSREESTPLRSSPGSATSTTPLLCPGPDLAALHEDGSSPSPRKGLYPQSCDLQPALMPTANDVETKGLPEQATPTLSLGESGPCPRGGTSRDQWGQGSAHPHDALAARR